MNIAEINSETRNRLSTGIKKFQPILKRAHEAKRNESDTVTIVTDILSEVFGYEKYEHITSEFSIKRQFCDLAIRLDGQICLLIECKAIGIPLKEKHIIQAVNYAANAGIDWVVLTNGIHWMLYRVVFSKPVSHILVFDFDFCNLNLSQQKDFLLLYGLCREAFSGEKNETLEMVCCQQGTVDKYIVGQVMLNDWMVSTIRRSIQRHFPSIHLEDAELRRMMQEEIFRPEIISDRFADEASQIVAAANARMKANQRKAKGRI